MNNSEMILREETRMSKVGFYHTQNTRLLQHVNCCLEKLGLSTVQITWDTEYVGKVQTTGGVCSNFSALKG